MKKLLLFLLMLVCFTGNSRIHAPLDTLHSKEVSKDFQDGRKKTVHVKSYKRKNGKVVKAHKRRPPKRH